MSLKPIFEKLYPSYSKKLWKFILDESINLFIQMLLICSLKFKAEEKGELLAKMATDKLNIRELFSVMLLPKDVDKSLEKIDLLTKALSDNLEEVPALIAKLKVAMGSQFNDNCTKCILRLRSDLTREEKVAIVEVIQSQKSLIEQAEKKEQRRVIKCNLLTEMRILNWLQRFRVRREQKLRLMADRDAARLQKQTLGIDEERKLEIEEELLGVRGYLDFYSCEAKSLQEFERIRVKPEKLDYNKYFFFFSDDVLQWKKKNTSSKSEGKVFITAIEEIGVEKDKYLCFVVGCVTVADKEQRLHDPV